MARSEQIINLAISRRLSRSKMKQIGERLKDRLVQEMINRTFRNLDNSYRALPQYSQGYRKEKKAILGRKRKLSKKLGTFRQFEARSVGEKGRLTGQYLATFNGKLESFTRPSRGKKGSFKIKLFLDESKLSIRSRREFRGQHKGLVSKGYKLFGFKKLTPKLQQDLQRIMAI